MKYVANFIHKNGKPNYTMSLTFGATDAVSVARECFELGKSGRYKELVITRVRTEKDNVSKKAICKMCDNYATDHKCEIKDTCKLMALIDENNRLKEENKRLKEENEQARIRRNWELFPDTMGK